MPVIDSLAKALHEADSRTPFEYCGEIYKDKLRRQSKAVVKELISQVEDKKLKQKLLDMLSLLEV